MKDDALIDANIIDVLKRIESVSDNKARVYLLTPPEYYCPTKKASLGNYVTFYRLSEACSTAGYGVTQQAAKALIHINTPLRWEADCGGMFNLLYGLEILSLIPPAITDGDTDKEGSGLEQ
jgi:glycosyl transferase family 25